MLKKSNGIGLAAIFGLDPLMPSLRQAWMVISGNPYLPPNRWGLSSVRVFKPHISFRTWLSKPKHNRRTPIYNFFNRVRPPKDQGYSVRVTYARDFLGGRWTYDGHNGTDFAVPVGTAVVSAAPGLVIRVANDFQHGGLKVCIDHGQGLFTTSSHLSRALVKEGMTVERGEVVGLSGASGMEFVLFFPWVAPHVHYNVWLNGNPIDPFAKTNETSMWRRHNDPVPWDGNTVDDDSSFQPSVFDSAGVEAAIRACRDPEFRELALSLAPLYRRAAEVMFVRNYRLAMFEAFPALYATEGERRPCLDLPFRREDFDGVVMPEGRVVD